MIIRIVQSKGGKDRHVMLPPEVLSLLRQWWKVRPTRYDAEMPAQERWLFPGRRRCPCCGHRMIVIETFARGCGPRHRATPMRGVIRIDTS